MVEKEPSRVDLLNTEELKSLIKRRLKAGWVVLLGDPELVQIIEASAYPPGTSENKLFELLLGPSLPGFGIFLAKKTEKLTNLLGNPPDLDKTICLQIMGRLGDKGLLVDQMIVKEGRLNKAINQIIEILGLK